MGKEIRTYVPVTVFMSDEIEEKLVPLRRSLSNMIEPLPLIGLVEWIYLTARRQPEVEKRLHSEVPSIDLPIRRSMRTSSVRMDEEAMTWLLKRIPIASPSALVTALFFWLAEHGLECHREMIGQM